MQLGHRLGTAIYHLPELQLFCRFQREPHCPDTEGVTGSIPVAPTIIKHLQTAARDT